MNTTRTKAIIWGLFLLLISVCLILWKLQFLHLPFGIMNVSVWGVLLGIVFLILFVHSIVHLWYTGILFSLAFLAIIFAKPLHIEALVPGTVLLAALLGSIALHLILRPHSAGNHVAIGIASGCLTLQGTASHHFAHQRVVKADLTHFPFTHQVCSAVSHVPKINTF